jgi:hypothetical protein
MTYLTRRRFVAAVLASILLAMLGLGLPRIASAAAAGAPRWWKGNTHTHSRWSDGADFPEMVADWYKSHGYHFLVVTDHNILQQGEKWSALTKQPRDGQRLDEYKAWLGPSATVETRQDINKKTNQPVTSVRLKPLADYRARFEEPGRFLLICGEEITDSFEKTQIHNVALSVSAVIPPQKGKSVKETLANDQGAVVKQEQATRRPMLAILCHPNWGGVVPVEDWAALPDVRFFEVMNSLPSDLENRGDANRLSTDRLWDVALAARLSRLGLGTLYGVAADDVHDVRPRGGQGWVMVRAKELSADAIVKAMKAGDFYASTGVTLKDVRADGRKLAVEVQPEPNVAYLIQFIGTLASYDRSKEEAKDEKGSLLPPTQRYSDEIGKVLQEVKGTSATFTPAGKELYVRAKVVSSKAVAKLKPDAADEFETAWTQPLVFAAPAK